MEGKKMTNSDSDELENLRKKHADVLNPAVDHIVNWPEPILGDGAPPPTPEQFTRTMKMSLEILLDKI